MGRPKKVVGACHIAEIKSTYKGTTYTTTLLRRTYREDGKVKHETLGNLSHLPPHALDLVRRALAGEQFVSAGVASTPEGFRIERTLPHGHVAAVLGTLRKLGVHGLLSPKPCRERELVCAMLVARVLEARSKLATARLLQAQTASSTLGEVLALGELDEDDLYHAMDWLLDRQHAVEDALAARHLRGSTLTLYDLSSTYFVDAARLPSSGTAATARATDRRSCSGSFATNAAVRSRSRCSRATLPTPRRYVHKSPSCASASG